MPFVEKELAAVHVGLHVRTNGEGDAIGIGILQTKENRVFGYLFFCFQLSLHVISFAA